jgi:hypothetical protein
VKLFLIVAKGKHQGFVIPIDVDLFLIGRVKMCQLRSKLPGVAAQHCAITKRDDRKAFIRDLGGGETILNGENLPADEEWPIHAGDHLAVGPLEFLVQFNEAHMSKKDAEEWALRCLDHDSEKVISDADPEDDAFAMLNSARPSNDASDAAAMMLEKLQAQKGIVMGRLRISMIEGVLVARFSDAFLVDPAEISLIKSELVSHLKRQNMRVLLDFKNVMRMSSKATEVILEARLRLRSHSGSLALCRLREELLPILDTLKDVQRIPYFDDMSQALAAKW